MSTVPLQNEVGHVRHWGTQVYHNGMVKLLYTFIYQLNEDVGWLE